MEMDVQSGAARAAAATHKLAEFVAELAYDDLPADVRGRAALILADSIGVTLRGSLEPEARLLREQLPAGEGSRLIAPGFAEVDARDAALANATAMSFMELDEGSRPSGHPALHVIPATLAYAEHHHANGRSLLVALVAGYEVQARIQWATSLRRSIHPHGNLGLPAAVAALGKLAGWNAPQVFDGITAAAGLAMATSWQPCIFGATVRNAYAGVSAETALTVRALVESGFTGYPAALGETFGELLGVTFDPAYLTEDLGKRFYLRDNYFKFHAACALVHPVLDALAGALGVAPARGRYPILATDSPPGGEQVASVEVRVPERALRIDNSAPRNQLAAKFSIQHATAAFLVRGESGPRSFDDGAVLDERIRVLADRVAVVGDPEMTRRWPQELSANVVVRLKDGRALEGTCRNPIGSDQIEVSEDNLRAKFEAITSDILRPSDQAALWRAAIGVADFDDMSRLLAGMRTGEGARTRAR